jgi:putative pre-16S rRNA nuclease
MTSIAGLDVGKRRIGIAIATADVSAALPVATIDRRSLKVDLEMLRQLFSARGVDRVVLGLPLNMDGSEGPAARMARNFARVLNESLALPVDLYDERLTSFEARQRLKGATAARAKRKPRVDAIAAALILEGWLAANGRGG